MFDGLITYWTFDDGVSPTEDIINGHNANLIGATFSVEDKPDIDGNISAIKFSAAGQHMVAQDPQAFSFSSDSPMSIALWLKQTESRGVFHVFGKRDGCSTIRYQLARDHRLIHFSSGSNLLLLNQDFPLNTWTHIAITYNGAGRLIMYADGIERTSSDNFVFSGVSDSPLKIATSGSCSASQTFPGLMDDFRVYDRNITAEEVAKLALLLPPEVTSITPNKGPLFGGTRITINGLNLNSVTEVLVGDTPLENLTLIDSSTITGNVPSAAVGPVDIVLSGPFGIFTITSGFTYETCANDPGTALRFYGNDLITFGNVPRLSNTHTLEAWVKSETTINGVIHGHLAGPGQSCGFGTYLSGSGTSMCFSPDPAGCGTYNSICHSVDALKTWTHIAGTFDNGHVKLYINGELVQENTGFGFASSNWMTAGAVTFFNGQQSYFNGEMDELRVWNIARSADEIRDNAFSTLTGSETGLVGYWRLDEGSGQSVQDLSSTARSGVLGTS